MTAVAAITSIIQTLIIICIRQYLIRKTINKHYTLCRHNTGHRLGLMTAALYIVNFYRVAQKVSHYQMIKIVLNRIKAC